MAERKREIQVKFWVTPEEKKMIRKKMILSKTANMGAYLRKMAIGGIIVNTDTTCLEKQFFEMHKIGVNVNQLARLANATGSVTPEEMKELKGMIKEIWHTCSIPYFSFILSHLFLQRNLQNKILVF